MRNLFVVFAVLAILLVGGVTRADVVYSSLPVNWGVVPYSDTKIGIVADNFTLGADASVTSVKWWGWATPMAPVDGFTVNFYEGNDMASATMVASFPAGDVEPTVINPSYFGYPTCSYLYDLPAPLNLSGGTQYFLSIFDNIPAPYYWSQFAATGDGEAWFWMPASGCWQSSQQYDQQIDLAFELCGQEAAAAPEPVTVALFLGSVSLGLLRRRRLV